ncbi:MAG TPA: PVC-type heme-binding CxxCH protein [Verrucomicrobiae bacterium]|nr:PVC-type heme-binding CxxCH protein [Verrucomicrobiae bacterium]
MSPIDERVQAFLLSRAPAAGNSPLAAPRSSVLRRGGLAEVFVVALLAVLPELGGAAEPSPRNSANDLTYLDSSDPFYVNLRFPKLTTPQWVDEPGVEAVIILAIDDMTESARYETFLRPVLARLKQIDGRAPVSIMTRSIPAEDLQVQSWLKEGLSIEAHTLMHPCPLLANGDFTSAATNFYGCIDLLNSISGAGPVAFRVPCCDSMDSASPRFYAELFNQPSPKGNFLSIDSSVMNLITTNDPSLPRELVLEPDGREKFRKYFPSLTNATTRVSFGSFATSIEDYPYPYVINRLCWEFPCAVPSDFEAFNYHGPTNPVTVRDWKAALDAVVLKRGVFTMIFHPYNWIRSDQLVQLIDYAASKYGARIKFLNFREALARLNHHLLLDQPLRAADGGDNGVRLLDLNEDGFLDVVIGNSQKRCTRIWNPAAGSWTEGNFPAVLLSKPSAKSPDDTFHFGILGTNRQVTAFFRSEAAKGAWSFDGNDWQEVGNFFNGLTLRGQPVLTSEDGRDRGVRLRDVDNDGECELVVGNESQNAVFKWSDSELVWKKLPLTLPEGTSIVNAAGRENGLRFVDLNDDGYADVLFSNERGYSVHLFIAHPKPWLGWEVGWSYAVRSGAHDSPGALPMISRGGAQPNNGAWFRSGELWVQNEDTSHLPDKVLRVPFKELQKGNEAGPQSTAEALASFHLAPGFKIELVASEPQVIDPVAFDWGPDGKLWVVEMRDYPLGMDGRGKPGGVVRVLEDTRGDGRYDKSTVFMDGIGFPNGIMPWGKGVLVSAAPDIFYAEDTDGDGRADVRRLLFTGFREGNQQHRVNGFEYGLDSWIYAANGGSGGVVRSVADNQELNLRGHDLRFRPDDGKMELQPGATQFGRHRDDWGDWFGNDNSHWLWHYYLPERYLARNPHLAVASLSRMLASYSNSTRLFPASRPQQRFNWPNALFEVTSACSANPYRDDLFGPEFETSVFICEPANNVIHREVLEADGVSYVSRRAPAETNSEFLASADNWCRPVMVKTGPDGALYFADMYRLVIEHPEYFPDELKQRPDLRAGEDKGRIYRIYPAGARLRPIRRLDQLSTPELVAALDSPNGWQRDTVQRLLVQGHKMDAAEGLKLLAERAAGPKVRLQALSTLAGLEALDERTLLSALGDAHWAVRRQALVLSESRFGQSPGLNSRLLGLQSDPDVRVRYQLAFSLGEWKGAQAGGTLESLMRRDWQNEAMQLALLSSTPAHLAQIVEGMFGAKTVSFPDASLAERLVSLAAEMGVEPALAEMLSKAATPSGKQYEPWQVAAVAGLASALDRAHTGLTAFANEAGAPLREILPRLSPLLAEARHLATSPGIEEPDRVRAIGLLARQEKEKAQDIDVLGELLNPQNTMPVQNAALDRLRQLSEPKVGQVLLKAWRRCGLIERQTVLNALLSRQEWIEVLLTALEQGRLLPAELGPLQSQKLLSHENPVVRQRAQQLFAAANSDRKKVLEAYQSVPELKGDAAKGHSLFTQNCSICHRLRGEGQSIGPDLGTMADKPVPELVVAILDPNRAVDPAYTAYTAITKDDRELTGVLSSESANSITLRLAGGSEEQVARSNLKQLTTSGRSLMPEGFETGLKPQDLADVIAYVLRPTP